MTVDSVLALPDDIDLLLDWQESQRHKQDEDFARWKARQPPIAEGGEPPAASPMSRPLRMG